MLNTNLTGGKEGKSQVAYSNLQKFYKYEEQRKLMVYLSRRGMTSQEIADLTWDNFNGREIKRKIPVGPKRIKLSRELKIELRRISWRVKLSAVPLCKMFYKEMPEQDNRGQGVEFTLHEIWRICGEPHESLLTKALYFATIRVSKVYVTMKELKVGTMQ